MPNYECPACGHDSVLLLGFLGCREHVRCRGCGIDYSHCDDAGSMTLDAADEA